MNKLQPIREKGPYHKSKIESTINLQLDPIFIVIEQKLFMIVIKIVYNHISLLDPFEGMLNSHFMVFLKKGMSLNMHILFCGTIKVHV